MKKRLKMPTAAVILVCVAIFVAILTYIVPAGSYTRVEDPVTGRTIVDADSYTRVEQSPVSVLKVPEYLYDGLVGAGSMIMYVFIIGGSLGIITATKAVELGAKKLSYVLRNRKAIAIFCMCMIFGVLGTTLGFGIEAVAFMPMCIAFSVSLGYDKMVGAAIIMLGTLAGSCAGVANPTSTGIAQELAEVPMFSGAWLRIIVLIVTEIILTLYLVRYGNRVKADPSKSVLYGSDEANVDEFTMPDVNISKRQIMVLIAVVLGIALLVYGSAKLGWSYKQISALFIVLGLVCGLCNGYGINEISNQFIAGVKSVAGGAVIIGFARAVNLILTDGMIIDTVIHAMSYVVNALPHMFRGAGMYLCQMLINLFIVSSSGQAVATMPIMIPLGDLAELTRQTTVLAFNFGDGWSNFLYPTCAALFLQLSTAKISYGKWVKFYLPLLGIWTAFGIIVMIFATVIGY